MRKRIDPIGLAAYLTVVLASEGGGALAQSLIGDGDLRALGLTAYWTARIPVGEGDDIRGVYLADDHVYVTTEYGTVFALQAEMGLLRWAEQIGSHHETILPPRGVVADGADGPVIVASTTAIRVMDRIRGDVLATLRVPYPLGGAVVGVGRRLYFGGSDARFYSLIWSREGGGAWRREWEVMAGGAVQAAPVYLDDGRMIYANLKGAVVCFHTEDKALDWMYETGAAVVGDPAADQSGVYVASMDRSLYKLDIETGEVLWRARCERPLNTGPALRLHTVYQYVEGAGLLALDAHSGREMWRQAEGRRFLASSGLRDYLWVGDDRVEAVHHETGKTIASARTNAPCIPLTNTISDAVYLVGRDGRVLCARSEKAPFLRKGEVAAAADRLNIAPRAREEEAVAPPGEKSDRGDDEDPLRSRRDARP